MSGRIDQADADDMSGDKDVFRVHLLANHTYQIELNATTLRLGAFTLRDHADFDDVLEISRVGSGVIETFIPEADGDYYIRVGSGGASTETGGYSLTVREVVAPPDADDLPDYPGDPTARFPIPQILEEQRLGATLETSGDRDLYSFEVIEGHRYSLSVRGAAHSGFQPLEQIQVIVREAADFGHVVASATGSHQASFPFIPTFNGLVYIQIGAGGSGSGTGSFGVSIYDLGLAVVAPPFDPNAGPAADAAVAWLEDAIPNLISRTGTYLLDPNVWDAFIRIAARMNDTEAIFVARDVQRMLGPLNITLKGASLITQVSNSDDPVRALVVGVVDLIAGTAITKIGEVGGGAIGGAIGGGSVPLVGIPFGIIAGRIIGGYAGATFYNDVLRDDVRANANEFYDDHILPLISSSPSGAFSLTSLGSEAADAPAEFDEANLIQFDGTWYISQYSDAAAAVASGSVGSAYAHFLTIGIGLGYRPNADQVIGSADLAINIANGDPAALGSSAVLTQELSLSAPDGLSTAEAGLAASLNEIRTLDDLVIDGRLSALASRKALDLVANFVDSAVNSAVANSSSGWAESWSNGNPFTQQFREFFEELAGPAVNASRYRLFVVASPSTSPSAELNAQTGFSQAMQDTGFDTVGVAEYGGIWVVIVADREATFQLSSVGADTLAEISVYGGSGDDTLYAGARTASLRGLDGSDILIGGDGNDLLEGGLGSDLLDGGGGFDTASYRNSSGPLTINLRNGVFTGEADGDVFMSIEQFELSSLGDTFVGGGGDDYVFGLAGDDTYFVDNAGDQVFEAAGEGSDQVYSSVSYVLTAGASVEVLAALDAASTVALNLSGNAQAQQIFGNAGSNALTSGGGADALYGGAGDDVYLVEGDDFLSEAANGGFDQVYSSTGISLSSGAAIEVLSVNDYASTNALTIIGNELAQQIFGNAGANILVSGGGQDALYGNGGDDIYLIDGDDHLVELAGGGFDQAYSSTGITLSAGAAIEVLSVNDYNSTNALTIIGNELAQQIFGNAGANILVGGGGQDALYGNNGDDIYLIDGDDFLTEAAGNGFDQAYSSTSITLTAGAAIEVLGASDSAATTALNLTGNEYGQQIFGNAGTNRIDGGGGNDVLYGLGGADSFVFTAAPGGANLTTIADFSAADDTILLDRNAFAGLAPGALNPNALVIGTQALDTNDRIIYNSATGQLFFDADGSGSGAAVQFATLAEAPAITAADFLVI